MLGIAIGHTQNQLSDSNSKEGAERIIAVASYAIETFGITSAASGVTPGWDSYWAIAAIRKKIPLTVVAPHNNNDGTWKIGSQKLYQKIISKAENVVLLSDVVPGFNYGIDLTNSAISQLIYQQVVDLAAFYGGIAVTLWDGIDGTDLESKISYVKKMGISIKNLWSIYSVMIKNNSMTAK